MLFNDDLGLLVFRHMPFDSNMEEKLEAAAEHTLYTNDFDNLLAMAIDFGAKMGAYRTFQLVKCGNTVWGFSGTQEQVAAKIKGAYSPDIKK